MKKSEKRSIKCLVWDLDNTIWDGILLEDKNVHLKENIRGILQILDQRGILQSISSKNEYQPAMDKLRELGLDKYFIHPQINWNTKSESIKEIAKTINIGLDTVAFVDNQSYERDEVRHSIPEVICLDALEVDKIPGMEAFRPQFITKDSGKRRHMYLTDLKRNEVEKQFKGPKEDFLKSLNMELTIFDAREDDLQRAAELTMRTNQLNTTGYTYSYDELKNFIYSDDHLLLMARLKDTYGTYGHIGLALVEKQHDIWTIKLLLVSCRVISRGIGSVLLSYVANEALRNKVALHAHFVETERNRLMNITYRLSGFIELSATEELTVLKYGLNERRSMPEYLSVKVIREHKYPSD